VRGAGPRRTLAHTGGQATDFSRFGAHICTRGALFSRFNDLTPKYGTLATSSPGWRFCSTLSRDDADLNTLLLLHLVLKT
jgi:hypothetical protein